VQNIPPEAMPIIARYERNATTPKMVVEIMRSNLAIDVRNVLPTVTVPTLVLHTQGDPLVPVALGRWLAEIARRVCDLATTDELFTSRTVKDLVIGSGIAFRGPWRAHTQGCTGTIGGSTRSPATVRGRSRPILRARRT
jgi:hypothetical protein